MTSEERIASLHTRMENLREKDERQKTAGLGAGCCILTVCLILLICNAGESSPGGTASLYSGATMLFENAGGYVTIAVAAFMIGVVITAVLLKKRFKSGNGAHQTESKDRAEE